MVAVLVALVVALVLFGLAWALLRPAGALSTAPRDSADSGLAGDRPVAPADVDRVSFRLVFRGYRMAEVDDTLDRLRDSLAERDAEIARLRAQPPGTTNSPAAGAASTTQVPGPDPAGVAEDAGPDPDERAPYGAAPGFAGPGYAASPYGAAAAYSPDPGWLPGSGRG